MSALYDAHRGGVAARDVRLDLLAVAGPARHLVGDVQQFVQSLMPRYRRSVIDGDAQRGLAVADRHALAVLAAHAGAAHRKVVADGVDVLQALRGRCR